MPSFQLTELHSVLMHTLSWAIGCKISHSYYYELRNAVARKIDVAFLHPFTLLINRLDAIFYTAIQADKIGIRGNTTINEYY